MKALITTTAIKIFSFFKGESDVVTSLIDIKDDEMKINLLLLDQINSFVACLGPPGAGKSAFCHSFYDINYGLKKKSFQVSDSISSFTKGLWILNEKTRQQIQGHIERDIIDVEGFQVDDIKSWKYVMIISFLATDIILLNQNARYDDIKKILSIMKSSFKKMDQSNMPRILKQIIIQLKNKRQVQECNIENILKEMNCSLKDFDGIKIVPVYIPTISEDDLYESNNDVSLNAKYRDSIKGILKVLSPIGQINAVAHLRKFCPEFNNAINGKHSFDKLSIIKELEIDYNNCYSRWEQTKVIELQGVDLKPLLSTNEDYKSYIQRNDINFKFVEKLEDLTFHGNSIDFTNSYKSFGKNKTFLANVNSLRANYESKKRELECGNDIFKNNLLCEFNKIQSDIKAMLSKVKFQGVIPSNYDCTLNVDITNANNDCITLKQEYEDQLINFYQSSTVDKLNSFKEQIERAKWKNSVQAGGDMTCYSGHNLNNIVKCGSDKGTLFWVDGDTNSVICNYCLEVTIISTLKCECHAGVNCYVKLVEGYRP